jgi:hypothetical protein
MSTYASGMLDFWFGDTILGCVTEVAAEDKKLTLCWFPQLILLVGSF